MKLKHLKFLWALLLLMIVPATFAQEAKHDMSMMHTPYGQIEGSKNPEQITDTTALRLWLSSAYPRTNEKPAGTLNTKLIAQIGLSNEGTQTLSHIVLNYQKSFDTIVNNYHREVAAKDQNADQDAFWKNVYGLVSNTLLSIKVQLPSQDADKFLAKLQEHKRNLSVSPLDYGLGAMAELRRKETRMVAGTPQGYTMSPNYSVSTTFGTDFPLHPVANSPFTNGWAQDTGTGNAPFTGSAPNVYPGAGNSTEANAYWPAGGQSKLGTSTMTLDTPPTNGNSIGVRTNISNNGLNFYGAYMYGDGASNNQIMVYKYSGGTPTLLTHQQLASTTPFLKGDQLTLTASSDSGQLMIEYVSSSTNALTNGSLVITYTDSSPLPAGYVGIQECDCGGVGSYANWTGGTGMMYYVTETISGTTTGSGWPSGTTHTPSVTIEVEGQNGSESGGGVAPNDYIDLSNAADYNPDLDEYDPTNQYSFDVQGNIECSLVGAFFGAGPGSGTRNNPILWIAATHQKIVSTSPVLNTLTNCTPFTEPPDYLPQNSIPEDLINWTGVDYIEIGFCSWFGKTSCVPPVDIMVEHGPAPPQYNCTSGGGTKYPVIVLKR